MLLRLSLISLLLLHLITSLLAAPLPPGFTRSAIEDGSKSVDVSSGLPFSGRGSKLLLERSLLPIGFPSFSFSKIASFFGKKKTPQPQSIPASSRSSASSESLASSESPASSKSLASSKNLASSENSAPSSIPALSLDKPLPPLPPDPRLQGPKLKEGVVPSGTPNIVQPTAQLESSSAEIGVWGEHYPEH